MNISLIVAKSQGEVIGYKNTLPWHLPEDLKHFKTLTLGKPILMGRKTYESIGRPLPGRVNIILTHDAKYLAPGCEVVCSLDEAFQLAQNLGAEELMVIGGAHVYALCLPYAQKLYITQIEADFIGDAYFPKIALSDWTEIERKTVYPDMNTNASTFVYHYIQYERNDFFRSV